MTARMMTMADPAPCFPFGQPVTAFARTDRGPRDVFVLGAYPSALHVAWNSPDGRQRIKALPVDNEPEPFWDGNDETERIEAWKAAVGLNEVEDGSVSGVGKLNGSSGVALDQLYLEPLGIGRGSAWVTDCLPTYYASAGVATAIADRFVLTMAASTRPAPKLETHPSENQIVADATERTRLAELWAEFALAQPQVVITLGNAAARVLRKLLDLDTGPTKLRGDGYGDPVSISEERLWYPLAHPGVIRRAPWKGIHGHWVDSRAPRKPD